MKNESVDSDFDQQKVSALKTLLKLENSSLQFLENVQIDTRELALKLYSRLIESPAKTTKLEAHKDQFLSLQQRYLSHLFNNDLGAEYAATMTEIGTLNSLIDLTPDWYTCALWTYLEAICAELKKLPSSPEQFEHMCNLCRTVLLDLSISSTAFLHGLLKEVESKEQLTQHSHAVNSVIKSLAVVNNGSDAARKALNIVREVFGWAYGSYWALSKSGDVLEFCVESGQVSDEFREVTQNATFARGVGVSGRAWSTADVVFVEDLGQVNDCVRAESATKAGVKSGVCLPLVIKGQVVGTIDIFSREYLTLSPARRDCLRSVAQLVSAALERIEAREQLNLSFQRFSNELTKMSSELKGATASQSSAAQELATSVSQVSTTLSEVRQASTGALQRAELVIQQSEESIQTSNEGSRAVENAVNSMREIREQVSEISERILTLSDQTSQIGEIISSVNEIAAQSKLLALNAAIEAARAGEHGKGFAVVATEIRSLSDQSKDATSQVRDILGEIQNGTNSAVVAAEEGTKKVATGMDLADRSGQNIHILAEAIGKSAESARLIANSARQQSAGVEQVAQAMSAISAASSNTVDGIRKIDEAAESLVQLSHRMQELVSLFTN